MNGAERRAKSKIDAKLGGVNGTGGSCELLAPGFSLSDPPAGSALIGPSMKIAIFTEYYPDHADPASGVYVHLRAAGYRQAGHDVRVYRVRRGSPESIDYEGVPLRSGELVSLRADVAAFGPNVAAVHTPYPGTGHLRLAEHADVPRILWIHGYEAMLTALHGYHTGLKRLLSVPHDIRKLTRLRRSLTRARAVVYVSEWIRRTTERGTRYRHPLTTVIPNPVDVDRFRPAEPSHRDGPLRGLILRPFDRAHGPDVAIAAAAGVHNTRLDVIGTGPDVERLRSLIGRLNSPVEINERSVPHSEMRDLLTAYDYFVSPERKTPTQGVAMCEAMACGLPIIAVRAGGVPEFARDGIDGFLVPRDDVAALRTAMQQVTSDPDRALAMGRNGRAHMVEKCSSAVVIPAELAVLTRLAS